LLGSVAWTLTVPDWSSVTVNVTFTTAGGEFGGGELSDPPPVQAVSRNTSVELKFRSLAPIGVFLMARASVVGICHEDHECHSFKNKESPKLVKVMEYRGPQKLGVVEGTPRR
jgi:hypothetical protein